jgi:hypothetical protein
MNRILKSSGYCSDGCQWSFCDFYETYEMTAQVTEDSKILTGYGHRCTLFANTELYNGSLHCCNQIYGLTYEGRI